MFYTRFAFLNAGRSLFVLVLLFASSAAILATAQTKTQTHAMEMTSHEGGRDFGPHEVYETAALLQSSDPHGRRMSSTLGTKLASCQSQESLYLPAYLRQSSNGISFQAPVDMIITGLNVPYLKDTRTSQSFQVILSQEAFLLLPSTVSIPSATAETVLYEKGVPVNEVFSVNIEVKANTYIGILAKTIIGTSPYGDFCFDYGVSSIGGNTVEFLFIGSADTSDLSNQQVTAVQVYSSTMMGLVDVYYTLPTASPSALPSNAPSQVPTTAPSPQPSLPPSNQPSTSPTSHPTKQPTMRPTMKPTMRPTKQPTMRPTMKPTKAPATKPIVRPTTKPTHATAVRNCFAMAAAVRTNCCSKPVMCARYLRVQCHQIYKEAGRDLTKYKRRSRRYVTNSCPDRTLQRQ